MQFFVATCDLWPGASILVEDVGGCTKSPISAEDVRTNREQLELANCLKSQWEEALQGLNSQQILDAYVAAEYGAQGFRLSKKHPLGAFCNDGFLPVSLVSMILTRYATYDFAKIRRDGDLRYNLPEAR